VGTAAAAALGIAISPIPLLAVAALLGSAGTTRTALAFVAGEALAVGAIAAIVVVVAARTLEGSLDSSLAFMQLGVAAALVLLLVLHLRMSEDETASTRVLAAIDGVRPRVALLSGAAMVGVNPKNLALTLAGAAAILELDQSGGRQAMALVGFTVIAVSLLVLVVTAYALAPARAAALLARGRTFTLRHERIVVNGVLLALALLFFTRGLLDLWR
jgi:threonine/homoserine/homoserine lactone efflux protein